MTFEDWMKVALFVYVGFLMFVVPWLAQKQADATIARWEREACQADIKSRGEQR